MIAAFVHRDGQSVRMSDASALRDAFWIDLQDPTDDECRQVEAATGFAVPSKAEVSEIEASSRLQVRDGGLYLSLPIISMADGPRGVSVGFVLTQDRLVSARFAPSLVFDGFSERVAGAKGGMTGTQVLVGLLEAIVDRQADVLEKVQADLDAISHRVFSLGGRTRSGRKIEDRRLRVTLVELGRLGDLISHIRDSQLGATRLVPFVESNAADWLANGLKGRLTTLRADIASVSDFATHLSEKLQFLLDATLGFISIAQNDVMKVMTIASVAGIPPVLVAGIYGMNFKAIPELEWSYGYAYAWALILLTTLVPIGIFWWRKWI